MSAPANPTEPGDAGTQQRTEVLLRDASLLLGRSASLDAVWVLHREIEASLAPAGAAPVPGPYASRRAAEERHRWLMDAWQARRGPAQSWSWRRDVQGRLPTWAAWALAALVGGGLCLRYAAAVLDRSKWQRQHPEGNWISRYYTTSKFEGYPLVRYDTGVDYDWGTGAPAKAMVKDRWSVRWDTCLLVTEETTVDVQLSSDDTSQLFLDEQSVIEVGPKPGKASGSMALHVGTHHVRVDFREQQGQAVIHLQGLDFAGTPAYQFKRPLLSGDTVTCD